MRAIFFICLMSVGIFSCEERSEPAPSLFEGEWTVTWEHDGDILHGEAKIFNDHAHIRAFGNSGSPILSDYEEAGFTITWDGETLKLLRNENGMIMAYEMTEIYPGRVEFTYLEDIKIHFIRK